MSTVACAAIQVIDSVTGFPSSWLTDDGAIFLDLPPAFDFGLNKNVEELTEINQLQISGVYGFSVPKTPLNQFVLRDWVDPNTFDFSATPVNVIAYSGGTVLTQRYLYVRESRWRDNTIECALVNDASHWAIGASRLRLNQIPYDDFSFTEDNVRLNMINDHNYSDGDAGIYFQLSNYGNLYLPERVTGEYLRPWYHVLGLLHKGFQYLGWRFESPLLETTIGRQWIAYLIDPEFYNRTIENKTLFATLTEFEFQKIFTQAEAEDYGEVLTITYDQEIDDPGDFYRFGRYYGFGEYHVEASIKFYAFYQVSHSVELQIVVFGADPDKPTIITKKVIDQIRNDNSTVYEIVLKTEDAITIIPGHWIEVRYVGRSNGRSSWTDTIVSGKLKIEPVKQLPFIGDTINPGEMLRPDFFIDFCKGVLHAMRGKVHTEYDCKTVTFYPNYPLEYFGEQVEGFYNDGSLVTVDPLQVQRSEVSIPPDFTRSRYILLAWKNGNDHLVRRKEEVLTDPLYSRIIDLGEEFTDDRDESRNPYFEATANDWIINWSTNGVPMDIPHLLDHQIEDDKVKISTNIGPRLLITKGWTNVKFRAQDGTDHAPTWIFGNFPAFNFVNYTWAFQLPLGRDAAGDEIEENLVYGELDNDLYNLLWKRWAFENIKNFKVDLLVYLQTRDFHNWGLRSVYAFLVGGKRSFGSLLEINQFNACRGVSTQVILNANATTVGQYPTEPEEEDPCDSYEYDLDFNEASNTYTFSVTTNSPGPVSIEWRYHDVTTWTVSAVVVDPDRLFYVRVLDSACGNQPVIQIPVDPCKNSPILLFMYRLAENGDHCVTATLGGVLVDPLTVENLQVSIDGGAASAYTLDTEVCGATTDFCFTGDLEFDNNCDPIPVDQCFEVPPVIVNCQDNQPSVGYHHVGLDSYQLLLAGSWVSPPSTWFFQFKDIGADADEAQIWDEKSPIVKDTFQARVIMNFCDPCPPVCSEWVTIPTPMALATQKTTREWDFTRMSQGNWNQAEIFLQRNDYRSLMKLHNDLKLSDAHYCCGTDMEAVKNWFEYGFRTREIR